MPSNYPRVEDLPGYADAVVCAIKGNSKSDLTKLVIPAMFADRNVVTLDVESLTKLLNIAHDQGIIAGRRIERVYVKDKK